MYKNCTIKLDPPITLESDSPNFLCSRERNFLVCRSYYGPEGVTVTFFPGKDCLEPLIIADISEEEFSQMKPRNLADKIKSALGSDIKKSLQNLHGST